jgi:diacylglycerol kinase (ATP)
MNGCMAGTPTPFIEVRITVQRKQVVALNRKAGGGRAAKQAQSLLDMLGSGWQAVCTPSWQGSVEETYNLFAAEQMFCLAAGGDGTLCSVINGYMRARERGLSLPQTQTLISAIPLGTANDVAHEIGIARDWKQALQEVSSLQPHLCDVAYVQTPNEPARYFFNITGIGFDAHVTAATSPELKERWGQMAYIAALLRTLRDFVPRRMRISLDGQRYEESLMLIAIANGRSYGGGLKVAPLAEFDDGWLDIVMLSEVSKTEFLRNFPKVLKGEHLGHPAVHHFRAREVHILTDEVEPVSLDGELFYTSDFRCQLLPKMVPFGLPQDNR